MDTENHCDFPGLSDPSQIPITDHGLASTPLQQPEVVGGFKISEEPREQGNRAAAARHPLRDSVLQLVLDNFRIDGYGEETQDQVRRHFATLPTRYALSVDPRRHDDVLLHVGLVNQVREQSREDSGPGTRNEEGPLVRVRRVGLSAADHGGEAEGEGDSERRAASTPDQSETSCSRPIDDGRRQGTRASRSGRLGRKRADTTSRGDSLASPLPRPAFGSHFDLSCLQHPSPSKANRTSRRQSPRGLPVPVGRSRSTSKQSNSAPSRHQSMLLVGSNCSLDENEELLLESPGSSLHGRDALQHRAGSSTHGGDALCGSPDSANDAATSSAGYSESDSSVVQGFEVTVAAPDRPGLLTCFTTAISHSEFDLDIKEAHVFSSTDGIALQVYVVTCARQHEETSEVEEGLQALLKSKWEDKARSRSTEISKLRNLKASVDAMCYEDWAVDPKDLKITQKVGGGSSGRLYKGLYRGHEVAVKVISLALVDEQGLLGEDPFAGTEAQGGGPCAPQGLDLLEGASVTSDLVLAQELLQCFQREVSIMRVIRHKNVLQLIGACSAWPRLFVVTELMAKGSVRDVLERQGKGLSVNAAMKVFKDAARGMDFLHRRGIIHRDLKAANLLIDENDVVKVCDFGVARLMHPLQEGDSFGESVIDRPPTSDQSMDMTAETGTYRWMAPEVLEHKPYGFKADVFSFGITMWEVLSGDIPYRGMTPLQAAVGVVQRSLRPIMPASVPSGLVNLIESCWNSAPLQRPSFSQVVSRLDELTRRMDDLQHSSSSSESSKSSSGLSGLWKKTFGSRK